MNNYVAAREELLGKITQELLGPGSEETGVDIEQEIISEPPTSRYTVGILYPQKQSIELHEENDDTAENTFDPRAIDNETLDSKINTANQYYPSSLGLSFFTNSPNPGLQISVSYAKYRRAEVEDCILKIEQPPQEILSNSVFKTFFTYTDGFLKSTSKLNLAKRKELISLLDNKHLEKAIYHLHDLQDSGWKRIPCKPDKILVPDDINTWEQQVDEGLKLVVVKRAPDQNNRTSYSVVLVNTHIANNVRLDSKCFYQVKLSAYSSSGFFTETRRTNTIVGDPEEKSLELLYRNKKTYAVGHGCAADWRFEEDNNVRLVNTEIIPTFTVPQMNFDIEELNGDLDKILEMKTLSDLSEWKKNKVISTLYLFCDQYKTWIDKMFQSIPKLEQCYQDTARSHMSECLYSYERMQQGVMLLERDEKVYRAFTLCNKAMLMQRMHSKISSQKRFPNEEPINWPKYESVGVKDAKWRPFQLAFILMTIESIADKNSVNRDIVDLIWFPTGGGKTEAYLGLSAFTIFLRRLKDPIDGGGVAIIMRYTLRLLTAQQFERAGTLICACEIIRQEYPSDLGTDPISLGLWIGGESTPNTIDEALEKRDDLVRGISDENPFQVISCPWCGTKLVKEENRGIWGYRRGDRPKRLILFCPETSCKFNRELPIKVVDDDIYAHPPTFLFSTVDKFAALPWKAEVSNLFALNKGNKNPSPELIIQDELHLISGPLGTMVGVYETAIDLLSSSKGINPKIIASTATIRRANEQCKALYNRIARQFPAPGINADDSFFAREADLKLKPGRLYVGIMSSGKTQTTTLIRLMGASLQSSQDLSFTDEVKDKYWTLVCYFNSIRELGKTLTLASDDVLDHMFRMSERKNTVFRKAYVVEELTSRKKAEEIPEILEHLNRSYPDKPIDILLASNMISVGVDINRLGLMTILGQPKTTSEYIQASSRVGRTYPGLVITLYDGARSRDRSHYEHFTSYHQSFYKFVEPTSVTPYSAPACNRGLHAVLISLVRHLAGLNGDQQAAQFDLSSDKIDELISLVNERVNKFFVKEAPVVRQRIEEVLEFWQTLAGKSDELTYGNPNKKHLIHTFGVEEDGSLPTLRSLRNVDQECNVRIID